LQKYTSLCRFCANDAKKACSTKKNAKQPAGTGTYSVSPDSIDQTKPDDEELTRQMANNSEQGTASIRKFKTTQSTPKGSNQKVVTDAQTYEIGLANPSPVNGRTNPTSDLMLTAVLKLSSKEKLARISISKEIFSKDKKKTKKKATSKIDIGETIKVKRIAKLSTTVSNRKRAVVKEETDKKSTKPKKPCPQKSNNPVDHSELHPPSGEESVIYFNTLNNSNEEKTKESPTKTAEIDPRIDSIKCLAKFKTSLKEYIEEMKREGSHEKVINTFEKISRDIEKHEVDFENVYQRFNWDGSDKLPSAEEIKLWDADSLMSWIILATVYYKQEDKRTWLKEAIQGSDPYTATLMNLIFQCLGSKINISKF